jgi:hypothetical protein
MSAEARNFEQSLRIEQVDSRKACCVYLLAINVEKLHAYSSLRSQKQDL